MSQRYFVDNDISLRYFVVYMHYLKDIMNTHSPTTINDLDISPFFDLMLAMARERSVEALLDLTERAYRGTHVISGALWFAENSPESPRGKMLRLMAHSGWTRHTPREWRHDEGTYTLVPLTEPVIGECARTAKPMFAEDSAQWERPAWAENEGIHAYATYPLIFKSEMLGVMAVFYDRPMQDRLSDVMRMHRKMHTIFADSLAAALANARAFEEIQRLRRELEMENEYLRRAVSTANNLGDDIVGESPSLKKVMEQIEVVAPTDATVLLLGESGTGKELLAQAIHANSQRRDKPLIRVNCSAIPRELFESEFFGHVKGSFTGAVRDRTGRFQLADGGTLFLDEVGEIPLELQGKLLRVLQEGTFERVGDEQSRKVDVRIVAATNKDLLEEVRKGTFRQDLYFRLSVFPIHNPPLRERPEDIPLLARHFIAKASRRLGIPEPRLPYRHIRRLAAYHWPGNVRELQNIMERAVIMADGGVISAEALPEALPRRREEAQPGALTRNEYGWQTEAPDRRVTVIREEQWAHMQRENIRAALEACNGRIHGPDGAAHLLGVRPTTLQSRIKKFGIGRQDV
ncbi:sigma-54-dependent Fis family transcriptional regulator [Oleidesulfovibrio alaskensis]|uniref:sigma-54-dependent Fis family transcriptional regulator n=2 Tax=Oleidesulfovibrio alaskensis TaxID=58180 RepID=UPI0004080BB9|nr:sigma 54-interacting transcriptional regulator [Oleidesulfovibrio alaskensis]